MEPGDAKAVAEYLEVLFRDGKRYEKKSESAAAYTGDEVVTVGSMVCWVYLAHISNNGEKLEPMGGGCGMWQEMRPYSRILKRTCSRDATPFQVQASFFLGSSALTTWLPIA